MIVVLSMNPSMDKTAALERFFPDRPNRIRVERRDLGGKGINVANAVHALGGKCLLTGFDFPGAPVAEGLAAAGIRHRLVEVPGTLRINMKLREEETGRTIEINEAGADVTSEQLQRLTDALMDACRPGDWVSLSGSLPPGVPADTYVCLCDHLKRKGCLVAVDCDGEPLRRAIDAGPRLIKPNAQEFAALTGASPADEAAAEEACRALMRRGVGMVCLSLGGQGARLYTPWDVFVCPAAPVTPRGVQGAGDAMLAGLLTAFDRGNHEKDALRFASAAAGASVMRPGTLLCRMEDVNVLLAADW